ncbi:MAG: hypothetical protein ORO03_11130, partial [Alphaproteobacteria bacterium]|nr:hypothetical protein [Alphaproteobacteria bacterium]
MTQTLLKEPVVSARKLHLASNQHSPISQKIPNAETVRAIEETMASKNLRSFTSVADIKNYLNKV